MQSCGQSMTRMANFFICEKMIANYAIIFDVCCYHYERTVLKLEYLKCSIQKTTILSVTTINLDILKALIEYARTIGLIIIFLKIRELSQMSSEHVYDHYRYQLKPVLKSKLEEFQLLGYETIKEDELWNYLTKKKWKKATENCRISELVQEILHVKVGEFMNFATIEAYKSEDFFQMLSDEEKKELLK